MQLSKAFDGYWLENESRLARKTVVGYRWALDRFAKFVGPETDVAAITTDDIRRYLTHCRDKLELSGKSRANIWVVLSSFFTWAEKEPALRIPHPIRGVVQQPIFKKKEIKPYTQEELQALMDVCDAASAWRSQRGKLVKRERNTAQRDKAIIILFTDTGLRASELCDLQINDYNEKNGEVHVRHGKGDKERTVVAGKTAQKALWRYLASRPGAKPTDPLFTSHTGQHLDIDSLRDLIKRLADKAGVKNATLHRFRHTFAINFLRNGANVIELQRFLGHENMATVTIYVNLAQSDIADAQRRASPADNWRLK